MPFRLPLFPLKIVLFPGALLPLHIFEPRYRPLLPRVSAGHPPVARRASGAGHDRLCGAGPRRSAARRRPLQHRGERRVPLRLRRSRGRGDPVSPGAGRVGRGCPRRAGAHRGGSGAPPGTRRALRQRPARAQRPGAGGAALPGLRRAVVRGGRTARVGLRSAAAIPRDPLRRRAGHPAPPGAARAGRPRGAACGAPRGGAAQRARERRLSEPPADHLEDIVGARWVRRRPAELRTFEADGLPTHSARPRLVVLPGTRDETIAVVRALHRDRVPWVARGAGTGLSGGALAEADSVLVVLTRLNRILALDAGRRRAVVEPGVVNAQLSEAAFPHRLHYTPDPSSQSACTLGGNVAENAGGPHCLKYGVTTNHVVALRVLLPDGTLAQVGSPLGEPWGPDLTGHLVRSEGRVGIALEITLRLEPIPPSIRPLLADFAAVRAASEAVSAIIAAGIVPAAMIALT